MELFYTKNIAGNVAQFDAEESKHCIKVLRYKKGDSLDFIDGNGTLYHGVLKEVSLSGCSAEIKSLEKGWGERGYNLHMAVAPVKNPDRYEWFMEKATELGFDRLTPVVGEHSERKTLKQERGERILLSAAKQSFKAKVPLLDAVTDVKQFILSVEDFKGVKLIGHCHPGLKTPLLDAVAQGLDPDKQPFGKPDYIVLIGPEGDFSEAEVQLAVSKGFIPVTMGDSRLRSETAALAVVASVYLSYI